MSLGQVFELLYYSHITLVALAMVLTGSISAVLYAHIKWQVVLLVGLSTFLTYSLDNVFDWKRDRFRYRNIQKFVQIYHKITYILIPAAVVGVLFLTFVSSNELRIGILLLGAAVAINLETKVQKLSIKSPFLVLSRCKQDRFNRNCRQNGRFYL